MNTKLVEKWNKYYPYSDLIISEIINSFIKKESVSLKDYSIRNLVMNSSF